jgi:RNA polymerase sigma-70 factor (ECF subfamily)
MSYSRAAPATHGQNSIIVNDRSCDEDTLRAWLEAHHAQSWSWALACCRGKVAQAEEALHLTYHKVLDHRARFDGRSSFKTWLFGVIRLTALDQRRWSWRRWMRWAPLAEAETRADLRPAAPDSLADDERCAQVRTALNGLAARQAEVLRLVFYHDLTLDEAAVAMGVSPGTARTHYERGKAKLRQRLAALAPS